MSPPTATNPNSVSVQCIGDVPNVNVNVVNDEADDVTANPVVTWQGDASDGNSCPEIITRTYRVTDDCGNFIDVTQTITVNDTQDPTGSAPAAISYQCIGDVPAQSNNQITDEADNCGTPTVVMLAETQTGTCPITITREWSITDDCNNSITVTQAITVDDTQDPTGSAPVAISYQCIGDVPAQANNQITDEADNCGTPTVVMLAEVQSGSCPLTITREWSITDACNNSITVTQVITVGDTQDPTASNPAPQVGTPPTPDVTVVTDAADNCSVPIVVWEEDVSDNGTCPEIITREYSVTDACGNTISVFQTFTIGDAIIPTASNPTAINVECITDVPATNPIVVTDEADNGATPTVTWEDDVSDNGSCPETITRRYRVTDDCGNFIFVTQSITVNDVTAPTASNLAAINIECIVDVPTENILDVTDEADNCTVTPVVAFVSDVSNGATCPETITRTYSVTDACGNTINVTQAIIVNDVTAPTASNLTPVNVECITDVPADDATLVNDEADNCTVTPIVAFVSDVSNGATCPEVILRTYSVTDACGNEIFVTQTITVNDITVPTATDPATTTVPGGPAPAVDITVVIDEADNCTINPNCCFCFRINRWCCLSRDDY